MDKTLKIRALGEVAAKATVSSNSTQESALAAELAKKTTMLEDEKAKSLELLKTIVQLRDSLKQEQAKSAESAKHSNPLGSHELAVKEAQLEEEKTRALENLKTIVQLRESLKQEQSKSAEMFKIVSEQESKAQAKAQATTSELDKRAAQLQ